MATAKQLKEEKRQTYLKQKQLNTALIKRNDVLPNGDIVEVVYVGKGATVEARRGNCAVVYTIKQTFINNEMISYIDFND